MARFDRLPAIPLIANDPYFSVWLPADLPTDANTLHWAGQEKWLRAYATVDGVRYRLLGRNGVRAAEITGVEVTPTRTVFSYRAGGADVQLIFWSTAFPDDADALSIPITFADFTCVSADGASHDVEMMLETPLTLCYDGASMPELKNEEFCMGGLQVACCGQTRQNVLGHSGDHITIDWGYLYVASTMETQMGRTAIHTVWKTSAGNVLKTGSIILAYDDIASVNYFGVPCRAWYARNGRTVADAIADYAARHDELYGTACAWDARVREDALAAGGEDYALIAAASWRHTFAAHKLIATPKGEMALLSKENDSNGCIGTVDVSYPSTPVFLRYNPELVNALCRPVLEFAEMPVWNKDYAPHDVGRYPHATGQVYGVKNWMPNGYVHPPYYQYPASSDIYQERSQMPVEECGNMLVMLAAAVRFGADDGLARQYLSTLKQWVRYLDEYGTDPGEQLCTDDFAGHLARNVNLAAKATVGVACCGMLLERFGEAEEAARWNARAHQMADSWLERASGENGTFLTFDGVGWSMKYNMAWDLVLGLDLLPASFYREETRSYLPRINEYGLPLDSRADYTKSDWEAWCAAMARDGEVRAAILAPIAHYLRTSQTRVAFSDWYDTKSGRYVEFIARSVQGGMYMPMLIPMEK